MRYGSDRPPADCQLLAAGGMTATAGDFRFARSRILADLATVLFFRGRDANTGQMGTLSGLLVGHVRTPWNLINGVWMQAEARASRPAQNLQPTVTLISKGLKAQPL